MIEYYRKLKENEKFFEKAHEIAKEIKEKAKRIFDDCEVFIGLRGFYSWEFCKKNAHS